MLCLDELISWPEVHKLNNLPEGIKRSIEIALRQSIASSLATIAANGSSGGGGTGAVVIGNYGGMQPTITPSSTNALVVDLPSGALWAYDTGTWTALIAA